MIQSCNHSDTDLGVLLDRSGLRSMYENWEIAKVEIARRLTTFKACADNSVLELICIYFIDDGLVFSNSYLRVSKLRRQLPFTKVILRASHRNHLVNDSLPTFHYGKRRLSPHPASSMLVVALGRSITKALPMAKEVMLT